jgi:hypothetical protein
MQKAIFLFLIISFILSSCGVNEIPENDDILIVHYEKTLEEVIEQDEVIEQEEIIEQKILEPLIIIGHGWDFFTMNYIIWVISLDGIMKEIEYEHNDEEEQYNINMNMNRFANFIYEQMNDDNIPVTVLFDRIPDDIIELVKVVETLELDKTGASRPGDYWAYYVIIGADEDRRAVFIGDKWGSDDGDGLGGNELTRAINEYLETTSRTAVD